MPRDTNIGIIPQSNDLVIRAAAANIEKALGLPAGSVHIGVEQHNDLYESPHEKSHPNLYFVCQIKIPGSDLNVLETEKHIRHLLSQTELAQFAQMDNDSELAVDVHNKLKQLTNGLKFDKHLLDWEGFDPKSYQDFWSVCNYAITMNRPSPYGVEFRINIPHNADTDTKDIAAKLDENITARIPEIKKMMIDRTEKYWRENMHKSGHNNAAEIEQTIAQVRADMAKLEITVNDKDTHLEIAIRSPEQAEAYKKNPNASEWGSKAPDNADQLRASNPLDMLSKVTTEHEDLTNPQASPQLNKALGRAFLYAGGAKAHEVFPLIAGRRDMYNALLDEAEKNPEKAAEIKQLAESNLFKAHDYGGGDRFLEMAQVAPASPHFSKNADMPDTVTMHIAVPAAKFTQMMHKLAAAPAPIMATPQPQINVPAQVQYAQLTATAQRLQAQAAANQAAQPSGWQKILASLPLVNSVTPDSWADRTASRDAEFNIPGIG